MLTGKRYLEHIIRSESKIRSRKGYLRLDMNENPSGLPESFIRKIFSRVDPDIIASYPEYRSLKEKIAANNGLIPENICLSNGSDAAIKYVFDAYVAPGDRVLLTNPTFGMYPIYCKMSQAKPIFANYESVTSFPEEVFMRLLSKKVKMAVVVNPNNPTGSVAARDLLLRIIRKAEHNNVLVVIDEAYFYFYPETAIEEVKNFNNLIVLRTFSKLCGMAGLRLGFAAASPKIINTMKKVRPTYDTNCMAVLLAEAVLDHPELIKSLINDIMRGKEYLIQRLCERNIEFRNGYANFILIKTPHVASEFAAKLREKNILVGFGFEQSFLKDFIRVTVGNMQMMELFWKKFIPVWNCINKRRISIKELLNKDKL